MINLIINKSKLKSQESILIIFLGLISCIAVAFFKELIFPEKYFFDTYTIQNLIEHTYKDFGDKSFNNTAKFFRYLHIDRYFLAPVIALVAYFFGVYFIFKKYNINTISFLNFALIVAYSIMAMVYISTYSKDLVVFILVILPFILFEKKQILIWTIFAIFYATFFRNYWFITILLFLGIKFFIVNKPKLLLLVIPIYYVVIAFIYHYIFGTSLSLVRYFANLDRDADVAQTAIAIFIKGDNFILEAANYFVTLIFLIIPVPLLLLAKPFYIILGGLIILFFYNFIKLYIKEYANKEYTNIFSFVISFMLVQSLFEPDYGSFVRHLAPLYPLIFVCIAKNTKFEESTD